MRLFLGDTCWDKIFELPKRVQNKVRDFQRKFKENPYSPAINLEKINTFVDSSLRTARVGDDYRAIIGVVSTGDYCLLYVDHHDEAMQWAENKRFEWNEYTQAFQIITVSVVETPESLTVPPMDSSNELPFQQYPEEKLLQIGVPAVLLPLVKSLVDMDDLGRKENEIPGDVFENLFYLLDGDGDIDRIIFEINEGKKKSDELKDQLQSINNKRRFIDITEDEELDRILDGDFEKWQLFLHPSQRKLVENDFPGTIKVSGGGGTGKTVAAIHRLKYLADLKPALPILYTTFTLALTDNLKGLIERMGVVHTAYQLVNIDALVSNLAKQYGVVPVNAIVIDFMRPEKGLEIWENIVAENVTEFDADFLRTEYAEVILYNNISSKETYMKQSRIGRVRSLSRKQRLDIWKLVEIYNQEKIDNGYYDRTELFNLVANYLNENKIYLYSHVIADEIQDFSNPELRFLRALTPESRNDLFLVGDPFQRIYHNRRINFTSVGINVRGVRSKRLRINYRTTEEIKKLAICAIQNCAYDDFDGDAESVSGYISLLHGNKPVYDVFDTKQQELLAICDFISKIHNQGIPYSQICISCLLINSLKEIQSRLHQSDIPYFELKTRRGNVDGVRLSSFSGMKGLEFKVVVLSDVNNHTLPYKKQGFDCFDPMQKKSYLLSQRSLIYVALTRAMQVAYITGTGMKSEII